MNLSRDTVTFARKKPPGIFRQKKSIISWKVGKPVGKPIGKHKKLPPIRRIPTGIESEINDLIIQENDSRISIMKEYEEFIITAKRRNSLLKSSIRSSVLRKNILSSKERIESEIRLLKVIGEKNEIIRSSIESSIRTSIDSYIEPFIEYLPDSCEED